jgi:osmotically-inducible protein OsmY
MANEDRRERDEAAPEGLPAARQGWIDPEYGRWRGVAPRRSEWGQGYAGGYGRAADFGHGDQPADRWMGQDAGVVPESAGPFAGRGPRGYRRADERILEDVCEIMTRHAGLDASDIEVRVADGEVTLEGTVADRRAKRLAAELAERASGVRDVHNRLTLARAD